MSGVIHSGAIIEQGDCQGELLVLEERNSLGGSDSVEESNSVEESR